MNLIVSSRNKRKPRGRLVRIASPPHLHGSSTRAWSPAAGPLRPVCGGRRPSLSSSFPDGTGKGVQRYLEVAAAIILCDRQFSAANIDLQGMQNQLGHR